MKTYVQKPGMWSCAYFRSTFQDLRRHFQAFGAVNSGSNPHRGANLFKSIVYKPKSECVRVLVHDGPDFW
jgi:hypothetical protein